MTVATKRPDRAIENLTHHQEQCDMDGVMVKVSRQALDEVLAHLRGNAQEARKPGSDDRSIPTYGQISWQQLGRDVMDAMYAKRSDYEFDPSYYPGHQMLPPLNFNSLARIIDKYRYYGASPAIPSAERKR